LGPRDEIGEWRRLHKEELHSLYRSSNILSVVISRRFRWADHVPREQEGRSFFKILKSIFKGKRPLQRPSCGGDDNIRMDLNYKTESV
jgi:hypothetical protein